MVPARRPVLHGDRDDPPSGATVAVGLFGLVLGLSVLSRFLPLPGSGAVLEPGAVLVGVVLAGWWAYRGGTLVESVALVLGPVLGRLTYFAGLYTFTDHPRYVALPLSFEGTGAWQWWLPAAVLLGVLAFAGGALARRGRRRIGESRSTEG
jgi:protein-S-isoprenylcysteine O-methyltransferase Ste14